MRLRHNATHPPSSETPSNRISAPLENPQLGVDSELPIMSPIEEVLAAKRPTSQIDMNSASSLSSVSIASTDTPPPPQIDELKLKRLSLQQQARNQTNLPMLYTPRKSNSSRNTYSSSTTSRESFSTLSKDSISAPIPLPEVLSPTLEMHLNQPDSLTVDVMKLPKVLHSAPALPNIVAPLPTGSARSSVMSVIPPMHNVWLDDDDDDYDKDKGASKMDLFSRKSIIRAKHRSTTSVNNYVLNGSEDEVTQTNTTTGAKRRNRMSFGFGREYGNETPTVVGKLKKTLSTRGHSRIRLDPLIDSPIRPTTGPVPQPESEAETELESELGMERPSTPSPSDRSHPTLVSGQASKLASPETPSVYRLSTASKFASASLSSKSSARTLASSSQQKNTSKRSTASKLLSLLTSKPSKLASKMSMDSTLTPATTATATSATQQQQQSLDKSKISAPLNFTHTAHVGGAHVKRNSGISVAGTAPLKLIPPSRPDRRSEAFEVPTELGGPGGSAPGLSCSSVSSLQRSSFVASPNTYGAAADNVSISTVSVDEAGLTSSPPPPLGAASKQLPPGHHRLFFSRLNTSNGSRSSLVGSDDASSSNGLVSWHSVDSLRSDHRASVSAQQQQPQVSTSPARYSLPPSTISAGLGLGSYRARSRLSVHSTISIDSAVSLSYSEMEGGNTTTTAVNTSNKEGLGLLPAPSMSASGPGSMYGGPAHGYGYASQQQQQQQQQQQRVEYSTASIPLDKVREEGWF